MIPAAPADAATIRKIANRSDHKWAHHVALAVSGGITVAVGFNSGTMHAEEMVVRKLKMSGRTASRLYSIRIRRDGRLGASKPCAACEKACRNAGIRHIFYNDYDGSPERMRL